MKIGIYGGTFNPPHLGHFEAARTAVTVLSLDKLLIVPSAIPPLKKLPDGSPSGEQRLAMTALMADGMQMGDKVEVSDLELKRTGASYTSDTLREVAARYPDAELWLLMGTDMFLTLHLWREPEEIFRLAGVCAFGRTHEDSESLFAPQREYLRTHFEDPRIVTISLPHVVDVSSTELRKGLAQGTAQRYLSPAVFGYILRNKLYHTDEDLKNLYDDELRACALSMVRAKRIAHIIGVEEESVRLAKHWGANVRHARHAGMLHDCTKYWSMEQHKALCAECGVELDGLEQNAEKLLHSKTGACIAREVFGEPDEVYRAIFWHTTAAPDMALLDKILYVADYIEPNRQFDGLEEMRRLAYIDLDRALLMGIEMTIDDMRQRGNPVHQMTLKAQKWLRERGVT